ncbi:hypothetical protein ABZY90_19670 [Streptomyces sp. NPDC006422]|uniref:helix-turn-helix transcriptional regulator n=1 Tax=unclassified Streptomyces TaxID=2593676 RepID=UPI00339FCCFE
MQQLTLDGAGDEASRSTSNPDPWEPSRLELGTPFPERHEPAVYFVRHGNQIKIGRTVKLRARLYAFGLRLDNVELLLAGGAAVEQNLHRRFAQDRVGTTEWFRASSTLTAYAEARLAEPAARILEGPAPSPAPRAPAPPSTLAVPSDRLIAPEIAERYGRSLHTVTKSWAQHPAWPTPVGTRGRHSTYAAADIAAFVRDHIDRTTPELEPRRLYTAREIEEATGITAATIRADRSRGRWPAPDDTSGRAHRWYGQTVTEAVEGRRGYHRS